LGSRYHQKMEDRIAAFISHRWSVPAARLRVDVELIQGGLESQVARARVRLDDGAPEPAIPARLIVKRLEPIRTRELGVYDWLWRHLESPPAVRVLGRQIQADVTFLYLEEAESVSCWPWSNTAYAGAVCRTLAHLHDNPLLSGDTFAWDYDRELAASASLTCDMAQEARDARGRRCWRRPGDLRRVLRGLPRIRERLLSGTTTVIHGDVHPGNVIVCGGTRKGHVVFVDWARARRGSPFEDVASWLHSLGCWEPEARRRHDTLMRVYLEARQIRLPFDAEVRLDYWLASASNGLAGAIRYHLSVVSDKRTSPHTADHSRRALLAWERVFRRVAALQNQSEALNRRLNSA
jgi:hypothetical protein